MVQGSASPRPFTQQIYIYPNGQPLLGWEQREAIWANPVKPFQSLPKQYTPNGGDGTGMHDTGAGGRSLQKQPQHMVVVKKNFRRYSENKLTDFADNFNTNLFSSTTVFPAPPITKTAVTDAIKAYEQAAKDARSERSDHNTEQAFNKRTDLLEKLDTQVDYVEQTATTAEQVKGVGLDPVADGPSKAPLPPAPTGVKAKDSAYPQSVLMSCKPIKFENSAAQVTYYVFETNEAGSEDIRQMTSNTNSRKLEFGGLTTGHIYYFHVRAKTSAGFGPPSTPTVRWVGR